MASEPCPKCGDSGFAETYHGGIWTGENVSISRTYCDCPCGSDAYDEALGIGFYAAHPTPKEPINAE